MQRNVQMSTNVFRKFHGFGTFGVQILLDGNALMERHAVTIESFLYQVACCGLQMYLIFVQ